MKARTETLMTSPLTRGIEGAWRSQSCKELEFQRRKPLLSSLCQGRDSSDRPWRVGGSGSIGLFLKQLPRTERESHAATEYWTQTTKRAQRALCLLLSGYETASQTLCGVETSVCFPAPPRLAALSVFRRRSETSAPFRRERVPDHEQFADMLYRPGAKPLTELVHQALAFLPVVVDNPDLDQFMGIEANADFLEDRLGKSVPADRYDRIQAVRPETQLTPLVRSDFKHR